MANFKIKFWGVRGSYPVPGKETVGIGGNTACVEIQINDELIIIDAGTGIIKLGDQLLKKYNETKKPLVATILFSHMHHDHNQGFPFFKPAYIGTSTLYFFGPKFFREDIAEVLSRAMLPPFFPVELSELSSTKTIRSISSNEVMVIRPGNAPHIYNKFRDKFIVSNDDIVIDVLKGYAHPKGGVIFYKIKYKGKSVVYASDTEGYIGGDQKLIQFAENTDILIHDAQYTKEEYCDVNNLKQGYGHSSPEMAAEVAKEAKVKKLLLFHHDPEHSDAQIKNLEKKCQDIFPASAAAYEGLKIDLLN